MLVKTRGILLHTLKYGETSVIAEIYTEEIGLRKYLINGARSKKSKIQPSCLQVMTLLDLVVYDKNLGNLQRLKEIYHAYIYKGIPFDLYKGSIGLFMSEVIRKAIKQTNPEPGLFNFLYEAYQTLDNLEERDPLFHLIFLIQFSGFLGFQPSLDFEPSVSCLFDMREGRFVTQVPGHGDYADLEASRVLRVLMSAASPKLKKAERAMVLEVLIKYYRLHIDGFSGIQSHHILQQVL